MGETTNSDDALGTELRTAVGRMYRRFRAEREDGDLGDAAMLTLTLLEKNGPQTLTELAAHDRVTLASMSQTVNRLASGGYARRMPDPSDGRKVLFVATDAGQALARATRDKRRAWVDARLAELTADEREVLRAAAALIMRMVEG